MDHYIDICLRADDAEMRCNELMAHVFKKVHMWIWDSGHRRIGLSFPKMEKTPGNILRVHGTEADLAEFIVGSWRHTVQLWLEPLILRQVPPSAAACHVKRVQKKSASNMRKRSVANGRLSLEQAEQRIPDSATKRLDLPYLVIDSTTTKQRVRFFIQQTVVPTSSSGLFSSYGMGQSGATVPWF